MAGLIPFNQRNIGLAHSGTGFESFYNMLDDFFSEGSPSSRSLLKDTFKMDIIDKGKEYIVEAELPGIKKECITLSVEEEMLVVSVKHEENTKEEKAYIHRERKVTSMVRRVHLADAKLDDISAKLEEGILVISIPKNIKTQTTRKIDIK